MATKRQAMKAAEKAGIEITMHADAISIDPPIGYVMESTRTHGVVIDFDSVDGRMPEVWDAVLGEIEAGTVECDDPDCDICHE